MEFTIYSVGESSFLEQILISITLISGSGSMAKLAMIGALLGVVFVLVQSVFQGAQSVNVQHILLGWVIYMCMFGPTARVHIEDSYSGHVKTVDNVPASVGIAGGMISNIGYGLTEMFEQGFGAIEPGANRRRYMESLEILTELQRNGNDSAIFAALNYNMGGGDIRKSWDNYIRECTATKIDLGESSIDEMAKQPIYDALRFESSIYGTQVFLPHQENLTCSEAFTKLQTRTAAIKDNPAVLETVNRVLGFDPADAGQVQSPMDRAQTALHSLGANQANAYDFMQAAILEPLYLEAVMGKHQDVHDNTAALMVNQAIQQRNTQWAAEQSMFLTVARPLMAFFEGFVFAVTPVMAFLIMLGGMGLTLAMKYVQSLLWIQLWMPTLAVINLYIHSAVSHEMASKLNIGSEPMNSMYALSSAADILGNWIAVGGMLAAATPIISLFFVTGSTYAFTSLAQRIGGSDHVNEKMAAPDIMSGGPVAQFAAQHQGDVFRGLQASGTESLMTGVNMGGSLDSATSSASATASQATEQFQQQFGRTWQNSWEQGSGYSMATSLGESLRSSNTDSAQALTSAVKNFANQHGLSTGQENVLLGALSAEAAARSGGEGPLSAGAKGQALAQAAEKAGLTSAQAQSLADNAQISSTVTQALVSDVAQAMTDNSDNTWREGMSDSDSETLTKTATEVVTATQTYQQLESAKTSAGAALNTDMRTLGSQVAANPVAMRQLDAAWQSTPETVKQEAADLEERYKADLSNGGYAMDPATAKAAARLTAMTNPANYEGGNGLASGFNNALGVVGTATSRNLGSAPDFNRHSGLEGPNAGGVRQQVEGGINQNVAHLDRGEVTNQANQDVPRPDLQKMHSDGVDATYATGETWARNVSMPTIEKSQRDIIDGNKLDRTAAANHFSNTGQLLSTAGTWATEQLKRITGGEGKSWEQMQNETYNKTYEQGINSMLTPAQADYFASVASFQPDRIEAAHENLRKEVWDRNANLDDSGRQALFEGMRSDLQYAAYRSDSPAAAGAGFAQIQGLNMAQDTLMGGGSITARPEGPSPDELIDKRARNGGQSGEGKPLNAGMGQ